MNLIRPLIVALCVCYTGVIVDAHTPVEFLEVVAGEPLTEIEHPIETQSVVGDARSTIDLTGPEFFSLSVGCLGRKPKDERAYLTWYRIAKQSEATQRDVKVLDLIRGMKGDPLTVGNAEYFLSPAQRITSGPPSDVPEGLDHYTAYRVVDAAARELKVDLTGSSGTDERVVGRPIFLCVPTEEWHHDDYFPATHPSGCFVVYELDEQPIEESYSFIDQFGLNQLNASKSRWLCVRGALSGK